MTPETTNLALATLALGRAALARSDRDAGPDGGHGEAENTYGLPEGGAIAVELREWFARQMKRVLDAFPKGPLAPVPAVVPSLTDWDDPMAQAMTPLLSVEWDESGRQTTARLGLDPDTFDVTSPHLRDEIHAAALRSCKATNATTEKRIGAALARLRRELAEGMVDEGESDRELTKRVRAVFENASEGRAARIAQTESSRAYHAAQEYAAEQSGVVAGLELLLSGDACPLCRMIAAEAKRVKLGTPFAVIGDNPDYSTIRHPPLHPQCQCSVIEVLTPEYGGPEHPDFKPTLVQPKPKTYELPAGSPEPKPEPARARKPVKAGPKPTHATPKPAGKPVGAALDVEATGAIGNEVRAAVALVDSVHGDGKLSKIPVRAARMINEGEYHRLPDNTPVQIRVRETAASPRMTTAHEVGHFVERAGIPGAGPGGERNWHSDPHLAKWYAAVLNTEAVRKLKQTAASGTVDVIEGGKTVRYKVSKSYLKYLLNPNELWARTYAQYVAIRSGDETMGDELNRALTPKPGYPPKAPTQWFGGDFLAVAKEMDDLFERLGWRK